MPGGDLDRTKGAGGGRGSQARCSPLKPVWRSRGGKRTAAGMAAYKYVVCFGLLGGTWRVSMVAPDFAPESAAAAAPPHPHLAGQLPPRLARHPWRCTWLHRLHVPLP